MTAAILLMLLTGVLWGVVGVLFGMAPEEKNRLYAFFSLNGILFNAFVWITQAPSASAPVGEVLRLAGLIVPSAIMEVFAFLLLKYAMNRGSQGIAWCIAQSAMVISFLCSISFLHNPSTVTQWAGMGFALASLVLFAKDKNAHMAVASPGACRNGILDGHLPCEWSQDARACLEDILAVCSCLHGWSDQLLRSDRRG